MAELHVIGEISHGRGFPKQSLFCKWNLQFGNNWKLVSGKQEGQTHVISSEFDGDCKWCFPIDVHLATKGIQGWPKIYIQIFHLDWLGRSHLFGYGFVLIPTTPGQHTVECYTWRPFGTLRQRFVQFFLGGGPQLKNPDAIVSANDRDKLSTEAMGTVQFKLNVIFRHFSKFGVEY
ncbi:B9 domain-containing protein 2 [Photinus pyralis]|nr:B9 domain-containing protein 2 [Photinus pyralis]